MILDAYATHLPVLRALGRHLPIRRVLEFGAGKYSTLLFADSSIFPHCKVIDSFEDDPEWIAVVEDEMRQRGWGGELGDLITLCADMVAAAKKTDLDDYDLIFIDSGRAISDRVPVIRAIAARKPTAIVVIHDFEQLPYQQAAAGFTHLHIFTQAVPWTAVLWNGERPLERSSADLYLLELEAQP